MKTVKSSGKSGNAKVNAAKKAVASKVSKLNNTKQQQPHGPLSKLPNGQSNG